MSRFLTIDEIARDLDFSPRTVERWVKSGQLRAHRFGRALRISPDDLSTFLKRRRGDATDNQTTSEAGEPTMDDEERNKMKHSFGDDSFDYSQTDPDVIKINGRTCRIEIDDNGLMHLTGPQDVQVQMREFESAQNRLLVVSRVIGADVNAIPPDVLDRMLADHHRSIVQFVPDGTSLDVDPERLPTVLAQMETFLAQAGRAGLDPRMIDAMKRSVIIRKHMIVAKLEEWLARHARE
jgi:excisionase family DNA binding protein